MAEIDRARVDKALALMNVEMSDADDTFNKTVEVREARARLKKRSVDDWRQKVGGLQARQSAANEAVAQAEGEFKAASLAVAEDDEGAGKQQSDALKKLRKAEHDASLIAGALAQAITERDLAIAAAHVVYLYEEEQRQRKEHEAAKAVARKALAKHVRNLEKLGESNTELLNAMHLVAGGLTVRKFETHPLLDLPRIFRLLYTVSLPVVWRPNEYDLMRAGFSANPNSHLPPPTIPTFTEALGRYLTPNGDYEHVE